MSNVATSPSPGEGQRLKYTHSKYQLILGVPLLASFSAGIWGKSHVSLAFNLFVVELSLMSSAAVSAPCFDKSALSYLEADSRRKNKIID